MQAKIKEACLYVYCAARSLNLVGKQAVDCCLGAVDYFGLIQAIYIFFSHSTTQWDILISRIEPNESLILLVLKSLSDTRWLAQAFATKAIHHNYKNIGTVIERMSTDENCPAEDRREAEKPCKEVDMP